MKAPYGCEPRLPTSDPCLAYNRVWDKPGQSVCARCKEEYINVKQNGKLTCKPLPTSLQIPNCLYYILAGNQLICGLCSNGYPSPAYDACVDDLSTIPYCVGGARLEGGKIWCYYCQHGYTANEDTGLCFLATEPGCAVYDEHPMRCVACDVQGGWSAQADGSCYNPNM